MKSIPTIQKYIRSPDIERVNFNRYFPIAALDSYFEGCSSNITGLGLDLRNISDQPQATPDEGESITQPKIQLSHLSLPRPEIMSHWLLHPRCRFEFSRLKSLETTSRTWCMSQDSPMSCLPFTESLVLTDFYVNHSQDLDLTALPALRRLDVLIQPSDTHFRNLMSVLIRRASSSLEIVVIRIDVYSDEFAHSFKGFDKDVAALAALHLALRRVDIHYNKVGDKPESMKSYFMEGARQT
ncbi:hypothetical protein FB451DRAFT_1433630 [Mycena latifolia]|nr:hypothetical protein FB451DRAFT_1433630 [Mycena latifolia]